MDPGSINIITEFAIAVAGFTGIVFALDSRQTGDRQEGEQTPLVRFRAVTMLFYAFSAAFGSLLPTIVQSFDTSVEVWEQSSAVLIVVLAANMAATVICSRTLLTAEQRLQLKGWMWLLVMLGNSVFAIWLAASLFGVLPIPITAAFVTALTWQLVLSTVLFIRIVAMLR
jgi:hypothetical protein